MHIPRHNWFKLSIILAVIFAVFIPTLSAPFLSMDDPTHITENEAIHSLYPSHLLQIFTSSVNKTYTPLTSLSFAVEYFLCKNNPWIYHFNNVLLHLLVTALLFFVSIELGLNVRSSLLASLLFGIHPMHVESVAWATERKDVLYSFFYLLSILFYLRYVERKKWQNPTEHLSSKNFYIASLSCAFLSMLSKPMALSLPLVLSLIDWLKKRPKGTNLIIDKIPYLLFIVPLAAITFLQNTRHYHFNPAQALPVFCWTLTFNVKKFFFPYILSIFYPLPTPVSWLSPTYFAAISLTVIILILAIRFRHRRLFIFGLFYYFLSIFFLLMYHADNDIVMPVADRFMYLPSAGVCLWLGTLVDQILGDPKKRNSVYAVATTSCLTLILLLLGIKTFQQCRLYQDEIKLWTNSIEHFPNSFYAYRNRGAAFQKQNQMKQALADYNQAIALKPDFAIGYFNRGTLYRKVQKFEAAITDYSKAISLMPDYPDPYNNRGVIYSYLKRYPEALADFENFVRLEPASIEGHFNRGKAYLLTERFKEALLDFTYFNRHRPTDESGYYLRGLVYINLGRLDLAAEDFRRTLQINPNHKSARKRLNDIQKTTP